jgi:hypothetical protein
MHQLIRHALAEVAAAAVARPILSVRAADPGLEVRRRMATRAHDRLPGMVDRPLVRVPADSMEAQATGAVLVPERPNVHTKGA